MRISEEKIKERLHKISAENDIKIEEDALKLVASLANGSMRDRNINIRKCKQFRWCNR